MEPDSSHALDYTHWRANFATPALSHIIRKRKMRASQQYFTIHYHNVHSTLHITLRPRVGVMFQTEMADILVGLFVSRHALSS